MSASVFVAPRQYAHAAATITVNSTDDTAADDGVCTLREAITAANTDTASGATPGECVAGSGADTINFDITGAADFTNGGQSGYTILTDSTLPAISSQLTIDGYSQTGAQANTAIAPNPLNGRLLIEIDGQNAGSGVDGFTFAAGSDSSVIKGLVINNFADGYAIMNDDTNIGIYGNYIGANYAGTTAKQNMGGITHNSSNPSSTSAGVKVGSVNAADRNLISGNYDFALAPADDWVVLGNYMGVAADGVTALGNSHDGGSGAITVDDCTGVIVGGTAAGSSNVISANYMYGISPVNGSDMIIQGNFIGTDYTGMLALGNGFAGILIGGESTNLQIGGTTTAARNIVSGNVTAGILVGDQSTAVIEGNYIGLNSAGSAPLANGQVGVFLSSDAETILGGNTSAARNVISANGIANVMIAGTMSTASYNYVQGNYIGTDASGNVTAQITNANGGGVLVYGNVNGNVIGGVDAGQPNRIAGNRGYGVAAAKLTVDAIPFTVTPINNAILGNSIYATSSNTDLSSTYEAIDLISSRITVDLIAPYIPDTFGDLGLNDNDPSGSVPGEGNDYLNHPVITAASGVSSKLTVTYDAVAAGASTGQYRIEFYGNDSAARGQAKTFLGYANVAPGTGLTIELSAPSGYDFSGKYITASTTQINDDEVYGYFGATSEFAPSLAANVVATTGVLPEVGSNAGWLTLVLAGMIAAGIVWQQRRLKI